MSKFSFEDIHGLISELKNAYNPNAKWPLHPFVEFIGITLFSKGVQDGYFDKNKLRSVGL
jgi:hypothetical protein